MVDKHLIERAASDVLSALTGSDRFRILLLTGEEYFFTSLWDKRIGELETQLGIDPNFQNHDLDPVEAWFLSRGYAPALEFLKSLQRTTFPKPISNLTGTTFHEAGIAIAKHNFSHSARGHENQSMSNFASSELVQEVKHGINIERVQALARLTEMERTKQSQSEGAKPEAQAKPLPDPFAEPRKFASEELSGKERKVIEYLCDAEGSLPLVDLAAKDGIDWNDEFEGFKNAKRRLDPKLERIGWEIFQKDKAGHLRQIRG